jgi:hypothetical protein
MEKTDNRLKPAVLKKHFARAGMEDFISDDGFVPPPGGEMEAKMKNMTQLQCGQKGIVAAVNGDGCRAVDFICCISCIIAVSLGRSKG